MHSHNHRTLQRALMSRPIEHIGIYQTGAQRLMPVAQVSHLRGAVRPLLHQNPLFGHQVPGYDETGRFGRIERLRSVRSFQDLDQGKTRETPHFQPIPYPASATLFATKQCIYCHASDICSQRPGEGNAFANKQTTRLCISC